MRTLPGRDENSFSVLVVGASYLLLLFSLPLTDYSSAVVIFTGPCLRQGVSLVAVSVGLWAHIPAPLLMCYLGQVVGKGQMKLDI